MEIRAGKENKVFSYLDIRVVILKIVSLDEQLH